MLPRRVRPAAREAGRPFLLIIELCRQRGDAGTCLFERLDQPCAFVGAIRHDQLSHRLEVELQIGGHAGSERTGSMNALAASKTSSSVGHGSESSVAIEAYGSRHLVGGTGNVVG
jgi:hypothetical protein